MSGGLVVVVMLLIVVGFLAAKLLSSLTTVGRAGDQATAGLVKLSEAIEQFVTSARRLPCPANPTLPTTDPAWGDEAVPSPNNGTCPFPAGTVPWRTVGARQEDAVDPWGGKISYRVFRGTPAPPATVGVGSLTQSDGVSMVECDTFEPTSGDTTPINPPGGVLGGVCVPNADVTLRSTRPVVFLGSAGPPDNKGLLLTDTAPPQKTDVAFVLLSHGATGLGAYTTAGKLNSLPAAGPELDNTKADGPFTTQAFSPAGTDPTAAGHFDDRLFYRTLTDLVRRTNLAARNWPEAVAAGTTGLTFDRPTLETALGGGFTPGSAGSVGQVTVTFTGVVATGIANGTGTDISFGEAGGYSGVGVAGGGSALIQSPANEFLVLQFVETTNTKFGVTLGDFGTYPSPSGTFHEFVGFFFFSGGLSGTNVASRGGLGCNIDGGLASFTMDVGVAFDTVAIISLPAFDTGTAAFDGISAFLVSEVAACLSTATSCITSLTDFGNTCSVF